MIEHLCDLVNLELTGIPKRLEDRSLIHSLIVLRVTNAEERKAAFLFIFNKRRYSL